MAKKTTKDKTQEVVANCNQFEKVVANCDRFEEHIINCDKSVDISGIENMIFSIRGVQVMIDRDLAMLYGVTTSRLNEQVKRNRARFPESFRFQLTEAERDEVVAICDNLRSLKYNPSLPYVFTEQGIAQLSSVLHSPIAIEVSIRIMNAFVAMRRFMIQNAAHLEKHQIETDEKIDLILDKIEEHSPKLLPEQVFATGCVWDAWTYISDLVRSARKRIVLIDNFVDDRVLSMLTKRADGVTATILTRYNEQFITDLKKHNTQYPEIAFIQLPHRNHDRFLIIDDKVYLLGASLKDIGAGLCAVTEMTIAPEVILGMVK